MMKISCYNHISMRKSQESQVPTDGIRQLFGHHVILLVLAVGSDTYPIEGIKY